jgi:tRNA threonylcarbamoyladenosine biosynthesis protein TsaE
MILEEILTLDKIQKTAEEIIKVVSSGKKERATILALSGDLGAGKTTITKEIANILGVKENVISPTFVIMKIYQIKNKVFKNLIHIDAYRLDKSEELLKIGWEEISKNKENLIIIEWPERVPDCLPVDIYRIDLEHRDENTRLIKLYKN